MGDWQTKSLYVILDVPHNVTTEEIESAYQRVMRSLGDPLAMYAMLDDQETLRIRGQIEDAYKILRDPQARAAYDKQQLVSNQHLGVYQGNLFDTADAPLPKDNQKLLRYHTSTQRRLSPDPSIIVIYDDNFSGNTFKQLRESASASLDDIVSITKISKRYLIALEENDFKALPAFVYVRGFVMAYARALGLDIDQMAQCYKTLYHKHRGEK